MKMFKLSVKVTAILGFSSVLAMIFLFLALSDIADMEKNLTLEWYVTGLCMIVLAAFIISTFVTLGFVYKHVKFPQI